MLPHWILTVYDASRDLVWNLQVIAGSMFDAIRIGMNITGASMQDITAEKL